MSSVEFDLSALEAWADNIQNMLESEVDNFLMEAAVMLGGESVSRVQKRTPIGNYDGDIEFTTNPREKTKEVSFTTKDGKDVFFIARNPPRHVKFKSNLNGKLGGELMKAWTIKSIASTTDGVTVIVHNPLSYAPHVEYGHVIRNKKGGPAKGFVNGKHMMQHTEIEMTFVGPELLKEKYNDFLEKVLG